MKEQNLPFLVLYLDVTKVAPEDRYDYLKENAPNINKMLSEDLGWKCLYLPVENRPSGIELMSLSISEGQKVSFQELQEKVDGELKKIAELYKNKN